MSRSIAARVICAVDWAVKFELQPKLIEAKIIAAAIINLFINFIFIIFTKRNFITSAAAFAKIRELYSTFKTFEIQPEKINNRNRR